MDAKKKIVIEVEGDEAKNLISGLKKVVEEITKPGLKNNSITTEEADILRDLSNKLK